MLGRVVMLCLVELLSAGAAWAEPELRLPLIADPGSLDSQHSASDVDFDILRDLFEGLVTRAPDGTPAPGMALSWETSPDNLVWTFHLREDARWSDGTPFTAEDFVYSFRREVDPATASPFAETMTPIAGAEAVIAGRLPPDRLGVTAPDPRTLEIKLARPTPWLLALLGNFTGLPVPRRAIETYGDAWTHPGNLIGNGAYKLTDWIPHGGVTIVRNPFYHDAGSVRIGTVRRVPADDPNTALRLWETGELDVVEVPYDQIARIRQAHGDALRASPWLATDFLEINLDRPELRDPRVRRALSQVIDRTVITQKLQHGDATPATGLIPVGFPGYDPPLPEWASWPMDQRVAAARKLMEAARGPDAAPLAITVRIARDERYEQYARVMLAVAGMWKSALGVELTLDASERRVWTSDMLRRNFQTSLATWTTDYLDPWDYLENYRTDAVGMNWTHYSSRTYDDLLDRSRVAPDTAARLRLMEQAEAQLLDDQPIIPLQFRVIQWLVNPHLAGWNVTPINIHLSRELSWSP